MVETKKRIQPGEVVASADEKAVLLHLQVVQSELHEGSAEWVVVSREDSTRKLRIEEPLTAETDLAALAKRMQAGCKYIKDSALPRVEEALEVLRQREVQGGGAGAAAPERPASRHGPPKPRESAEAPESKGERRGADAERRKQAGGGGDVEAKPSKDSSSGAKGSRSSEKSGKKKSRREQMSRESKEAKREVLAKELEARKLQQRRFQKELFESQARKYAHADIERLEEYMEQLYEEDLGQKVAGLGMIAQLFRKGPNLPVLLANNALLKLLARTFREAAKKSMDLAISVVSVFFTISNFSCFHELVVGNQVGAMTIDLVQLEVQRTVMRTQEAGISPRDVADKMNKVSEGVAELTPAEAKTVTVVKKQDRLLYLAFYLLLNLAEDVSVEHKMQRKGVVPQLIEMLDRCNVELLILAVTFLKRLSIYRENKELMIKHDIIGKLAKFVPTVSPVLMTAVLRLLHNLSFDHTLRENIVDAGLVAKLVDLMQQPQLAPICMGVLYHISTDDKHKSLFSYTRAVSLVYERLVAIGDLRREPELIALAVNLSQNARNAAALCEGPRFDKLMQHALDGKSDLLFKVMRNCSQVDDLALKRRFSPYVERCVMLLRDPGVTPDLFVEVLGTLANLSVPEFDFEALAQRHDLLNFLTQFAEPGVVDDDILLEVIMFLGVLCNEGTAEQIAGTGLIELLFQHMADKKEDDEFVLQITFTFSKLLAHAPTCRCLLEQTDVVDYLVELLQDTNKEVRKHADKALEVLVKTDPERVGMVTERKFETFNQEWLHCLEHPDDPAFAAHHGVPWGGEHLSGTMDDIDGTLRREDLSDGDSDDAHGTSYLCV